MGFFDKLTEHEIARKDGMIIKCMEDYIDGFQVSGCQQTGATDVGHAIDHMAATNLVFTLLICIIICLSYVVRANVVTSQTVP